MWEEALRLATEGMASTIGCETPQGGPKQIGTHIEPPADKNSSCFVMTRFCFVPSPQKFRFLVCSCLSSLSTTAFVCINILSSRPAWSLICRFSVNPTPFLISPSKLSGSFPVSSAFVYHLVITIVFVIIMVFSDAVATAVITLRKIQFQASMLHWSKPSALQMEATLQKLYLNEWSVRASGRMLRSSKEK